MIPKIKIKHRKGLTMIELMTTMLISTVIMLGVTGMLVDSLKGWKTMYDRLHSNEADNTYVLRKTFDRAVRQATSRYFNNPVYPPVAANGNSANVFYYDHRGSTYVDRLSTFTFTSGTPAGTLTIDTYIVDSSQHVGAQLSTQTIRNVAPLVSGKKPFVKSGRSVQMLLTIQNNKSTPTESFSETLNVLTSGYVHNW